MLFRNGDELYYLGSIITFCQLTSFDVKFGKKNKYVPLINYGFVGFIIQVRVYNG